MKTTIVFFTLSMWMLTALTATAQEPVYPKPNNINQILSGKKMPPGSSARDEIITKAYDKKTKHLPYTSFDTVSKQFVVHTPDQNMPQYLASAAGSKNRKGLTANKPIKDPLGFHLTKDINTSTEARRRAGRLPRR